MSTIGDWIDMAHAEDTASRATITRTKLMRWAGASALIAGVCYMLVGIFHPANIPSSVTTTRWQIVHVIACAMSVFGILGMAGLYARQARRSGWPGLVGYVLLSLWLIVIMGFSFVEAFVLPHIATTSPGFVVSWMGMFNGPKGTFDIGALPALWLLSAPMLILGGLLFGFATFRAGVFPRWAGALLAVSTVIAPVAALLPNASQPKIAIPMGAALAWLGYALWSERPSESGLESHSEVIDTPAPALGNVT
jgi:hypothetical protein